LGETFTASISAVTYADSYIWTIPTDYLEIQGDASGTTVTLKAIAVTPANGIAAKGITVKGYNSTCDMTSPAKVGSGTLWIGDCANTTDDDLLGQLKMKDVDGNVYTVRPFGPQCWMTQNLRVSRGPNGENLKTMKDPVATDDSIRLNPGFYNKISSAVKVSHNGQEVVYTPAANSGSGANYTENGVVFTNQPWDEFADKFGFLYAYGNASLICPTGWHFSTTEEKNALNVQTGESSSRIQAQSATYISGDGESYNFSGPSSDAADSGFGLLPSGYILDGTRSYAWGVSTGWSMNWGNMVDTNGWQNYGGEEPVRFLPVRCVRD
jgi:uncharacterized protein (TIGR02145 family)